MRKQVVVISIIFSLIFLSSFVLANNNCIPNLNTNEFFGTVYVGSQPLTGGNFTLTAMIGDNIVGAQKIKSDGSYSIDVSPCPSVTAGQIYFYVGDTEAKENGKYNYNNSAPMLIQLNLNLKKYPNSVCGDGTVNKGEECDDNNIDRGDGCSQFCEVELGYSCSSGAPSVCSLLPYCGDGSCNGGETCSTCSSDCGACATTTSSGGGSGGSSGGSRGGGGGFVPKKITNTSVNNTNSDLNGMDINSLNENKTNSESANLFSITGAAIGDFVKTPVGKGILAVIILVLVMGLLFSTRKNSKKYSKQKTFKVTKMSDMKKKK
jgi:cysteine-rich repeat protein